MLQRRRRVFAVDTIPRCDNPADDLLVGWKDIASYLKCSVRKAQRLERQELPINRIRGTKSVWASKSGIDRWLILQSEAAKRTVQRPGDTRIIPSGKNATVCRLVALALMVGLTIAAGAASAYGITIVLFGATVAVFVVCYPCLPDNVYTRAGVGLFLIAGMSYGTSAASLPNIVTSIINMKTLPPATAYPFVIGLPFIPIPVLIAVFWAALGNGHHAGFSNRPWLRAAYVLAGTTLIVCAAAAGLSLSEMHRIWQSGLPIRSTLLLGEFFVLAINAVLFVFGYRFLNTRSIGTYRPLFSWCCIIYLLIGLTAAIVNRHSYDISIFHLDAKNPDTYRIRNMDVEHRFRGWLQQHSDQAGADLAALSTNCEFSDAMITNTFYKQPFDEPLQFTRKAVIFGYRIEYGPRSSCVFVLIRFPSGLAETLGFEPVRKMCSTQPMNTAGIALTEPAFYSIYH